MNDTCGGGLEPPHAQEAGHRIQSGKCKDWSGAILWVSVENVNVFIFLFFNGVGCN